MNDSGCGSTRRAVRSHPDQLADELRIGEVPALGPDIGELVDRVREDLVGPAQHTPGGSGTAPRGFLAQKKEDCRRPPGSPTWSLQK
jgi:hypothetical protein